MPASPDLMNFIRAGLAQGASREQLTESLIQNNWQISDITMAFDEVQQPSQPQPTPAPVTSQDNQLSAEVAEYGEVDDMQKGTMAYIWKHHRITWLISLVASIVLVPVLLFFEITSGGFAQNTSNSGSSLEICFVPLLILIVVYSYYGNKRAQVFEKEIAASLNLSFQLTGNVNTLSGHLLSSGGLFGTGRSVRYVMTGTYQNIPITIFTFCRVISEGKHSRTVYATVFSCTIGTSLPDLILVPVSSGDSATNIRYSGVPKGYKQLPLEGNFDNYFHFYIPENSQIDALQILQPDIMAILIDKYSGTGFEFTGNTFYVYPERQLTNREDFLTTLGLVQQIYNRILPTLQEMKGS